MKHLRKSRALKAIHPENLQGVLSSLGVLDLVKAGKCHCEKCGKVVSLESLGAIVRVGDHYEFFCKEHLPPKKNNGLY